MCKDNVARHGLKIGDMVGILGPTTPSFFWKGNDSYIGRIGRIKAFGSGVNEGQCAVFVNGKHWWFPESSLCKISPSRGRTKPRRKTAQASGRKEYTAGALASVPESPWQAKAENWRVMFPDGQNVKLEEVGAGAGSEPQPEASKAEPKFKPFDKVLVRDDDGGIWIPAFYGEYIAEEKYSHGAIGCGYFRQCIPYEGNESLAGTTNDPEKG